MPKTLAVVSDLHCHPSGEEQQDSFFLSDGDRVPASHHPIQALLNLIEDERIRADVLLMPGDITNRVNVSGLHQGWNAVREIQRALGAPLLAATPGNHDVDSRRLVHSDPFRQVRRFHPQFPVLDDDARQRFWADGYCILDQGELRVVVLNSVVDHHDESSAKRGEVPKATLEALDGALAEAGPMALQVAVVHHHPVQHEIHGLGAEDLMVNGSLLVDLLGAHGFCLLVHGHKHHPRLKMETTAGRALAVFAAGSVSACSPWMLSNTRNTFHVVEIDAAPLPNCGVRGTVSTWAFHIAQGWRRSSVDDVDFPPETGFGCDLTPEQLAPLVTRAINDSGERIVTWDRLVGAVPQLSHVPPATMGRLEGLLTEGSILVMRTGHGEILVGHAPGGGGGS